MIPFVGLASGLGAGNEGCQNGPVVIRENFQGVDWKAMIHPTSPSSPKWEQIPALNAQLAQAIYACAIDHPFVVSIGGDHSCAVGTWSGVAEAMRLQQKDIGLIWIDAHMDSHTPETSESGNIHGMPLASLLGTGAESLTHILSENPKLKPENVFLVGIRSFEEEEKRLLERLNVRIYYMDEVRERGLKTVLAEIVQNLKLRNIPYGISLDVDFFDPSEIIATGTPESGGGNPEEFIQNYSVFESFPPIAFELVEFNPDKDTEGKTLQHILRILDRVSRNRIHKQPEESVFDLVSFTSGFLSSLVPCLPAMVTRSRQKS